ncbi:MAG: alpha amylase [Clostridiales bacterium]|jgi:glycosidase|nr:alpha amylase [Clostridiales bacterium]
MRRITILILLLIAAIAAVCGCSGGIAVTDPLYGNYYEIFVGSFYDSDGDGMGDLNGITQRLDYINDKNPDSKTSLHVDGIWLMPIMPSPSYHKYDVTDYFSIDPAYGTMKDFENLLKECKNRGVKVIIDLVLNHTSNQHPWFLKAAEELAEGAPGEFAAYYNVKDTLTTGFHPFGTGGPQDLYYQGVFVDAMPDLNFDNENVKKEIEKIAKFWLDKGVAGFRLDAIKHIYSDQGQNVEFIKWFSDYCRSVKKDVFLVGEVWSAAAEINAYAASGINSLFNFPFAQQTGIIANAIGQGAGEYFSNNLIKSRQALLESNPDAIDAPFLSNHDLDRSAVYFSNDLAKQKMAAALYLFMPGNPFIYYGEEIGMTGSGKDENKRAPFHWSASDSIGETSGPSGMTSYIAPEKGAAEQLQDENSLLRFYIDAVALKNKHPAIAKGATSPIDSGNKAVAAYQQTDGKSAIIILHNLGFDQASVTLPAESSYELAGFLAASGGDVSLRGNSVDLPGFSSTIIVCP